MKSVLFLVSILLLVLYNCQGTKREANKFTNSNDSTFTDSLSEKKPYSNTISDYLDILDINNLEYFNTLKKWIDNDKGKDITYGIRIPYVLTYSDFKSTTYTRMIYPFTLIKITADSLSFYYGGRTYYCNAEKNYELILIPHAFFNENWMMTIENNVDEALLASTILRIGNEQVRKEADKRFTASNDTLSAIYKLYKETYENTTALKIYVDFEKIPEEVNKAVLYQFFFLDYRPDKGYFSLSRDYIKYYVESYPSIFFDDGGYTEMNNTFVNYFARSSFSEKRGLWEAVLYEDCDEMDCRYTDKYFTFYFAQTLRKYPKQIESLFQLLEKSFYKVMTPDNRMYNDFITAVEDLTFLYELVNTKPDYQEQLKAFYPSFSIDEVCDYFGIQNGGHLGYPRRGNYDYWAVTFWIRRAHEENAEVIYKILKRIDNHYKNIQN